jgi:hypothetical protein
LTRTKRREVIADVTRMAGALNLLMGSLWMRRTAALLTASAAVAVVGANASAVPGAQPPALPSSCSDSSPCRLAAGRYRLGYSTVIEGLQLTLPRGWSSTENSGGELKLVPPGDPNEWLFIWLDLVAVKSTGRGAGTILPRVGRTPTKVIRWLTHNPDFAVVSRPRRSSLVHGLRMTTLALGVSTSANFGDPECPSNPRCAALFKDPKYWGESDFYAIGAPEEVRLYLGTVRFGGASHTLFVALDAKNHARLSRLTATARGIIASLRLPTRATGG